MKKSGWHPGISLLIAGVLFCTYTPFLPVLLFPDRSHSVSSLERERWEICSAVPGTDGSPPIASPSCWQPVQNGRDEASAASRSRKGTYYWLRTSLPAQLPADPLLLVRNQPRALIYIGPSAHSFELRQPVHRTASLDGSMLQMRDKDAGQTIWIHAYAGSGNREIGSYSIGNSVDQYAVLLREDALKLVLTVLFLAVGIASFCFYIANRQEPSYGYFGLFSLILAYAGWVRTNLAHMVANMDWLPYIHDLSLPMCLFAWLGFWESILGDKAPAYLTRIKNASLGFVAVCLIAAGFGTEWYDALLGNVFPAFFVIGVALCFKAFLMAGNPAASPAQAYARQWLIFGFSVVAPVSVLHILINYKTPLYGWIHSELPTLTRIWGYDQVFLCAFVFDLCLGLVLINRFMATYRRVQQWNRTLEEQVRERTLQLEDSYRQLQASTLETAEALAELSVMEERNRIS